MKGVLGFFLLAAGFGILVRAILKDASDWYFILGAGALGYGLDLVITDKIDEAKKGLREEIKELTEKIDNLKEEKNDYNPYD